MISPRPEILVSNGWPLVCIETSGRVAPTVKIVSVGDRDLVLRNQMGQLEAYNRR